LDQRRAFTLRPRSSVSNRNAGATALIMMILHRGRPA
jgi:hypothetical protein